MKFFDVTSNGGLKISINPSAIASIEWMMDVYGKPVHRIGLVNGEKLLVVGESMEGLRDKIAAAKS